MSCYPGEIRMFAGTFVPAGWIECDGRSLPIESNVALANVLGKTYGGDYESFNLPNLAGNVPISTSSQYPPGFAGSGPLGIATSAVPVKSIMALPGTEMDMPLIGEVRTFAFGAVPRGWYECNGQSLPIASNPALYTLLQTRFGGDGKTSFAVPNLNGVAETGAAATASGGNAIGYLVMNFCIANIGRYPSH